MTQPKPNPKDKSPVVQATHTGDSVLARVRLMQQGLFVPNQASFLDLTHADPDMFIESMNVVVETRRRFESLPSKLRAECLNDPRNLLALVRDAQRGDEDALGVLKRHKVIPKDFGKPKPPDPVPAPPEPKGDGSIPLEGG